MTIQSGVGKKIVPHIRHRGGNLDDIVPPAERWVVERSALWINRIKKLFVRFEKKA
ncbi:MAG: hypothetical protein ACRECH_17045 [Nitrososphaerales archaeon]